MIRLKILGLLALSPLVARAANPIFPGADPHAAVFDGTMWIYPTFSEKGKNFWAFKLTPQKTWEKVGPVLDLKDVPWLKSEKQRTLGPWAPCIAVKGTNYYFYYSVGPQSEGHPSRIGVAVGNSPAGPFKDSGKALLTGEEMVLRRSTRWCSRIRRATNSTSTPEAARGQSCGCSSSTTT